MPTVDKIDVNSLIKMLMETYGSDFIYVFSLIIILIFGLIFFGKYLRSLGYFKTPLEKSIEGISQAIANINKLLVENSNTNEELIEQIIRNQEFKLSDEQISCILNDKEYIYSQQMIDICLSIYVKNHIKENREKTINKIESSINTLVIKEDKEVSKLPNIDKLMLSTNEKIKIMKHENLYQKIYDIMVEFVGQSGKTEDFIRNAKTLIINHISTYWFR
jgi:hypothetical protein